MASAARPATQIAPRVTRLLSFLGFALSVHTAPAAAQVPAPVPPSRGGHLAPPPWSGVRTNPPRVLTRAWVTPPPVRHPALHPMRPTGVPLRPLFPRAGDVLRQKRERQEAMQRHPAGKGLSDRTIVPKTATEPSVRTPVDEPGPTSELPVASKGSSCDEEPISVRPGDSLWSIASSITGPRSRPSVAELTQQLFEMNRDVIGPDPDLIYPGQKLSVPKDCPK